MVGGVFYCARGKRSWDTDSIDLNATSRYSEVLLLEKSWQVETAGTWVGTLTLELSTNGFDWQTVRQWESKSNRNINDSGEVTSPHWMRLRWVSGGAGASNPMATIDSLDSYFDGFFKIDAVTDARNATGTTLRYFDGASVDLYAEAAFTKNQGFPKTACLHEGRLCFASTDRQPNSIWLSQSDDYLNFRTGTDDNEGIARTLQAPFSDPILWLASQRRLFIGTSKAEYVSGSETSDQPLTPSNFVARKYTNAGSSRIPPLVYDDGVIFAGRGGGRIHEIGFEIERSSYAAEDLSRLAEHITAAGVQAMDFQQTREPRLWLVRSDGALLCLAYNRKERLAAWSKITTQAGSFTDVVVFAGDDGDDEVYFLIKRGSSTCLERFPAGWQAAQEENNGWLAVDGVMGTGTNITVPAHLQDTDITLLLNGDTNPVATAVNYSSSPQVITSADWQIGFPIVAQYQSLPIDAGAEDGSTLSRRKRIHKASLSLYQSRGGSTWNKASGNKQAIPNTQASEVLRTGWEDVILDPGHLDDVQLRIYHADPFPFTVRAAALRWRVTE